MIVSSDASSRLSLPRAPMLRRSRGKAEGVPPGKGVRVASQEPVRRPRLSGRARALRSDRLPSVERMAVRPHDRGWQLTIDGVDQPAWVVRTKAKAVQAAREAASFHQCPLDVHGRNGARQKTIPPAPQA